VCVCVCVCSRGFVPHQPNTPPLLSLYWLQDQSLSYGLGADTGYGLEADSGALPEPSYGLAADASAVIKVSVFLVADHIKLYNDLSYSKVS
jgi:hypothetical protein